MPSSLWLLSWREWRHHPWRHGMALLAVALGVALAWSVYLINASALAEFSAAVRAANGEPDLSLRGPRDGFDDALFERVAQAPGVQLASPLLELDTTGRSAQGERVALRVLGIDALNIAAVAPQLLPRAARDEERLAMLDPDRIFLNARARQLLGLQDGDALALRAGAGWQTLQVAGDLPAAGPPLAVMDIAGAQAHFGMAGRLTRIDLRLQPGQDAQALLASLALPPGVQAVPADAAEQRLSALSRAYRVNLMVLALVALFVGAFLIYSVVSLSLAQRTPAFALLGVLGLTARERRRLVLAECAALGLAGSLLGLLLGTLLAALALRWLAGDLGGGYFPGIAPTLRWDSLAAIGFAALGALSAPVGGWMPARRAEALSPAQALKGLGDPAPPRSPAWPGALLLALGTALAFLPPLGGLPLAAYLSVAALLFGGVALVPAVVQGLLRGLPTSERALGLLALRRAHFQRHTASAAVAGVVASLALSVALTVMVTSFRGGVADWLDQVLPADLYVRSAGSSAAAELAWLDPAFVAAAAALPGVQRVAASRVRALQLAPQRPQVTLIARPLAQPAQDLPLLAPPLAGDHGVYLSEAAAALYDKRPGDRIELPIAPQPLRVLGVWRDYARQFGAIAIDAAAYRALTGDTQVNDLALWLRPGADAAQVQQQLRALDTQGLLEFSAAPQLRALSLAIFDRSFAVTTYLQAVAIAIGLVGVAASLSAQVLARRKEFGLLSHLGLTRAQIVGVVAGEGAAWLAAGTLIGLALGLAVSVVLVHVVNPQSFHWTMQLRLPWGALLALCAAVLAAGIATAAFSARHAASAAALRAVQEDW
ncbi:MAG: ABC transporter permease [Rubrivivax sp.]|nr:ABC transporter permease [Rubrivivax sp.]